ncbi:hypothetical protein KIM372_12300 [Bombiscardovia nodaiensis]|uniref:Internalin-A n=1 Tax=Bombiscardovia nodaiensis TaxID=2932181 RepID=A0ABM8B9P1_9BIFI|nr:hypothetical protein KIM372_12300 [Bombiscardovia nodaiensis]
MFSFETQFVVSLAFVRLAGLFVYWDVLGLDLHLWSLTLVVERLCTVDVWGRFVYLNPKECIVQVRNHPVKLVVAGAAALATIAASFAFSVTPPPATADQVSSCVPDQSRFADCFPDSVLSSSLEKHFKASPTDVFTSKFAQETDLGSHIITNQLPNGATSINNDTPLGEGIADLSGLEVFTHLQRLSLYGLKTANLTPLQGLQSLKDLRINLTQLGDTSPLGALTNLNQLTLSSDQISDVSFLSHLTNLTKLDISDNNISDISALRGLTGMTELNISSNRISNIDALSDMNNLTNLTLEGYMGNSNSKQYNSISDISALRNKTQLVSFRSDHGSISDISPLKDATGLKSLILEDNQISDISVLSGLTQLESLDIHGNQVSDLTAIQGLTKLKGQLWLDHNKLASVTPIAGLLTNIPANQLFQIIMDKVDGVETLGHFICEDKVKLIYGPDALSPLVEGNCTAASNGQQANPAGAGQSPATTSGASTTGSNGNNGGNTGATDPATQSGQAGNKTASKQKSAAAAKSGDPGQLAQTGAEVWAPAGLALTLMIVGAGALAFSRRLQA